MAPQSCVMNPAHGSPPSVAAGETSSEDVSAGGMGTDELDLSAVRRCKGKSSDLPFSVESLISDRTPDKSLHSAAECGPGCVRAEETECPSPRVLYRSKLEAVDLSDKDMSHWSQAPYASPSSEFRIRSSFLNSLNHALWKFPDTLNSSVNKLELGYQSAEVTLFLKKYRLGQGYSLQYSCPSDAFYQRMACWRHIDIPYSACH